MTRAEDVGMAATLGAEYVGVIFAGGPRHQTPDGAIRVLGGTSPPPRRVAVVAEQTVDEIVDLVKALSVDVVQLHAAPSAEWVSAVRTATGAQTWAVVQLDGSELPPTFGATAAAADAIVLDARGRGGLGGSGITLPWQKLAAALEPFRATVRLVLAGGLRPENVGDAIAALRPDVVDVSSGVESAPGIKNHERMREFRDAVRRAGA